MCGKALPFRKSSQLYEAMPRAWRHSSEESYICAERQSLSAHQTAQPLKQSDAKHTNLSVKYQNKRRLHLAPFNLININF